MGIRISMRLVVGVDNLTGLDDKRFSAPFDIENLTTTVLDRLSYSDGEFGTANLFGLVVNELPYASQSLYALATIDEQYQSDGYTEAGKYNKKEDRSAFLRKPSFVCEEQFYKLGLDGDFVKWKQEAMDIFERIGFTVNADDLRLYLEWWWS